MQLDERHLDVAGLRTTAIGDLESSPTVVLLHGYGMGPEALAPFAHSLGLRALFLFPRGPLASSSGGHCWWEINEKARAAHSGPRDLSELYPRGLDAARQTLAGFVDGVVERFAPPTLVIGGFSQGGMLGLDLILRTRIQAQGVVLLSASRIAAETWQAHAERLQDLPVFVSHGETDPDLAFGAGLALRDFAQRNGARVTWAPFPSGHEIPLIVWRALRKFLTPLLA